MFENLIDKIRNKHEFIFKILLFIIAVVAVVYLLPKEGKFKYEFQKNTPWVHEDLFAPFDFAINKTEEEIQLEKDEAFQNLSLYFNYNQKTEQEVLTNFNVWLNTSWNDSLQSKASLGDYYKLCEQYISQLYRVGIVEINEKIEGKDKNYTILIMREDNIAEEVALGELYTIKTAYEYINKELEGKTTTIDVDYMLSGLENVLKQNIFFNESLTQKDFDNVLNNISLTRGAVLKDEKIISTGEIVITKKYNMLQSLKLEYEAKLGVSNQSIWIVVGQFCLVVLFFYSLFIFLKNTNKEVFETNLNITFVGIIMLAFIGATAILVQFEDVSVYVIPFCIIPILIRTFFGNRLALFVFVITIFLISFIVPNPFEFVLLQSITGIITLYTVLDANKRSELFYTVFIIFFVISVSFIGLSLIQEGNIENIAWDRLNWFGLGALLTLFTYPLIYVFEKVFGYISDITLLELADTNNELLRELNLKAPGTFQHSLQVSNLAEEAIREIGGNPLLVRAGALYHDIGKTMAPAYFIENQTGVNPHDDLAYDESAGIIIDHVIRGIELAKKHNLPEQIIDFIRTHHGTTSTQYFLRMHKNDHPDEELDVSIFQYPGPIPYSKETAVLMMADSVEAASRSLKHYDKDSITGLVEGVINFQVKEEQFVNTNITFRDVTTIKKMFIKKLMNIYHVRIEYPK